MADVSLAQRAASYLGEGNVALAEQELAHCQPRSTKHCTEPVTQPLFSRTCARRSMLRADGYPQLLRATRACGKC